MEEANAVLDRFLEPIRQCLTPEQARALVSFRVDAATQAKIDELARKGSEGELTDEERTRYEAFVDAADFIAILQAEARELLRDA